MSKDGFLPDDVKESDIPGYHDEHHASCPAHEDAVEVYSECGGQGECECYPDTYRGRWNRIWDIIRYGEEICVVVKDPDCACADIAADDAASYADAREAAREDR